MKLSKPPYKISDRTANIVAWAAIILSPLFYIYMITGWGDDIYHTLAIWGSMTFSMFSAIHILGYYAKRGWDVYSFKNFHDAIRTIIAATSAVMPMIILGLMLW